MQSNAKQTSEILHFMFMLKQARSFVLLSVFFLLCSISLRAQTKISIDSLQFQDSVQIQTYFGVYYYGTYVGHTTSHVNLINVYYYDTLKIELSRIAEIVLIDRKITNEIAIVSTRNTPFKVDKDSVLPKNNRIVKQIIYGSGAFIAGALGGAFIGVIAGAAVGTYEAVSAGLIIGSAAGSTLLCTKVIVNTGDSDHIKGKFGKTLTGVALGTVGSFLLPIGFLFAPATVGTIFYTNSRYRVQKK